MLCKQARMRDIALELVSYVEIDSGCNNSAIIHLINKFICYNWSNKMQITTRINQNL